ncbi:MAG: prepilin-type N-terminal cleavage/methylation domain-containing protein [Thermoanaerobaculia bacterium]
MEHQHDLLERASRLEPCGAVPARARGAQGFSLIEVLIAAAIFLIIALGLVPFFTQAIANNRAGADFTQSTNYAKSELERLYALPMSSPDLQVTAGSSTVTQQYYSLNTKAWVTTLGSTDVALWTRTVTIRQYSISGMLAGGAVTDALPAGAPAASIHAKQIEVKVQSGRAGGPLGGGKQVTLSVFKSF